jgi:hypothetical protein
MGKGSRPLFPELKMTLQKYLDNAEEMALDHEEVKVLDGCLDDVVEINLELETKPGRVDAYIENVHLHLNLQGRNIFSGMKDALQRRGWNISNTDEFSSSLTGVITVLKFEHSCI